MLDEADDAKFRLVFPQFSTRLSPAGLKRLLASCTRADFRSGRHVLRDKMPTDGVYFVLTGEADIFVEHDDRTINLGTVTAGQLLGEVSILSRQMTASSTVLATSNMTTLKLKHQALEGLLTSDETGPVLLDLLSETLASRLRVH